MRPRLTTIQFKERTPATQRKILRSRKINEIKKELRHYYETLDEETFINLMLEKYYYNCDDDRTIPQRKSLA